MISTLNMFFPLPKFEIFFKVSLTLNVNWKVGISSLCYNLPSEAECDRCRLDVRYSADTHIANSSREFQLRKASFDQEVNTARAESELAYKLQAAKERQKIRKEEVNINIVERRKQIEIEEKGILCTEKNMDATVRRPAEAEAYRLQQIAEAQAEADGIRLKGIAKAEAMEAVGRAEAERMRLRAEAYSKYAAEVAAPLSKTKEIVIMNGSNGEPATLQSLTNLGKDFTTLVGTVPHAIRALTNVDLSQAVCLPKDIVKFWYSSLVFY
ncbi:flotillin [Schistosoma bovis]|uniref:Flotillin n=1 Tax=Schistosoma bovis TaxID=6184 RepID=A0A430QTG6_SCHBO|nr:flotillin [Schistosoma bovis]